VRVTIEKKCSGGINDGAKGKPFCRGGRLVTDHYTGASLVRFVAAPHYRGDVKIGFVQNSSRWWPSDCCSRGYTHVHYATRTPR
jgi:hypothetical protein